MQAIEIFQDYSIPYATHGKNISQGWIGLSCPFCDDHSTHLGFNPDGNYFVCWRCGNHPLIKTFALLLKKSEAETTKLLRDYGLNVHMPLQKVQIEKREFKIPTNVVKLQDYHKNYLIKRGFDPDQLARDFKIQGLGPVAKLDGKNYRNRIFIPFYWKGKIVTFDTRDITGKDARYKACPKEYELIPHKDILYGRDDKWGKTIICVEGPTDVWRLGFNACAVSGIKFTQAQVRVMAKLFEFVYVVFDNDSRAQMQANKLVSELELRKVKAIAITIKESDPGKMTQADADYFVKQLIG